jgi:hypothetical protein
VFDGGVVQFDLVDEGCDGFNKFIPYYLFPDATYTVALTRGPQRTSASISTMRSGSRVKSILGAGSAPLQEVALPEEAHSTAARARSARCPARSRARAALRCRVEREIGEVD